MPIMTTDIAQSYVDYIDDVAWQQLVGKLLCDDRAEIISRHADEIFNGMGAGTYLYRVTGTAATGRGRPVDWTTVIKVLTLNPSSFQSISTDPTSWDYWKREWHIYQSPWQQQLPGPLVAPRCLATGDVLTETDEEMAWIAMQDLHAVDHRPWPHSQFRDVARHLGVFNGQYLCNLTMPSDLWLSQNWLRGWTELAEPVMDLLPTVVLDDPVAGRIFTPDVIDDFIALWNIRAKFYEALDQLPQTLCHNDVFPRNVFIAGEGHPDRSFAIDWAYCGPAAVGQDLATLIGMTQAFRESRPERWDDLERDCIDGYAVGLRQAGWNGTEEVHIGYLLSNALRVGMGCVAPLLSVTLTTEHQDLVTRTFKCSYDAFVANSAATMQFQQRRIRQAKALLGL
jgi:hypothetical protein